MENVIVSLVESTVTDSNHASPLIDIITALKRLGVINLDNVYQRYAYQRSKSSTVEKSSEEYLKSRLDSAMEGIELAGRCLTRYLENNGGLEYLKAVDPLKYLYKGEAVTENVAVSAVMHTHGQFYVPAEDCELCMRDNYGERRKSPGLIGGGQGPKEFV